VVPSTWPGQYQPDFQIRNFVDQIINFKKRSEGFLIFPFTAILIFSRIIQIYLICLAHRALLIVTKINFQFNGIMRSSLNIPSIKHACSWSAVLQGMASMLHNSSFLLNMGLSTLARYLGAQPLLNITVHDYLWGYEDQLVRLASHLLPTWLPFSRLGLMDRVSSRTKRMRDIMFSQRCCWWFKSHGC